MTALLSSSACAAPTQPLLWLQLQQSVHQVPGSLREAIREVKVAGGHQLEGHVLTGAWGRQAGRDT